MDEKRTFSWKSLYMTAALLLAAPASAAAAPDPMISAQWALSDSAAIGAREAWTQSTGTGVLVAVLDTGLQIDHPDLAANVWTNPGEVPGNGVDDDHNGIVDDVHGANMFDRSGHVDDDNGHGTHVAGIVAALKDNGIGGAGVAPEAKIMAVKVLDATMSGTTDTLASGIRYAVDAGAKILSASINTDTSTYALKSAVRYAGEHGAIVVASAGNNGRNIDVLQSYPASLTLTDSAVLSVAATSADGRLWQQSNTGLLTVNLAAPGDHIVSTTNGSAYQSRTGTSAAAPFVSGSLALLSAARPDLPMSALREALLATTNRSDVLASLIGGGRLDVGSAMHRVLAGRPWRTAPLVDAGPAAKPTLTLRAKSTTRAGARATLRWRASAASIVTRWRVSLDGRVVATVPASSVGVSRRISRTGRHTWRVIGLDAADARVVTARRAFKVIARRAR
jgi:subtilisin family serine protease